MRKTIISCAAAVVAVAFALVFGQDDDDENLFKPFEFGCSNSTKQAPRSCKCRGFFVDIFL